jgi:hypothetical protein
MNCQVPTDLQQPLIITATSVRASRGVSGAWYADHDHGVPEASMITVVDARPRWAPMQIIFLSRLAAGANNFEF